MSTIADDQVLTALRDVVAKFGPETTYPARYEELTGEEYDDLANCLYQIDGEPACLVGVVLDRLGIPLNPDWDRGAMTAEEIDLGGAVSAKAMHILRVAQSFQDNQKTWGEALRQAEAEAGR